ncbi:hypothetical protein [Pseudomonas sp. URMO17WK12:I11]|uniref:hypothetical protein n=1 Tax=Pseudomonas sp. URMO17WK12:I11 TaxID=1283291 RepID=UPI0011A29155|nr:hypothetical protein [Pseudomonas sp. URMO17WK12:I11]
MTSPVDAALSALQSTVDALRAELSSPQARKYKVASQTVITADRFELRGADGKVYAAGLGMGVSSPFETALSQGMDAALEYLAAQIAETKLVITAAKGCAEAADAALHDRIERVVGECLRRELRPGGMLHRG